MNFANTISEMSGVRGSDTKVSNHLVRSFLLVCLLPLALVPEDDPYTFQDSQL
jgi:hypothetical protein